LLPLFATSVIFTSGKFSAGVVDTRDTSRKLLATVINDTSGSGGQISSGVFDTSGAP
jgi:hypothetical protein